MLAHGQYPFNSIHQFNHLTTQIAVGAASLARYFCSLKQKDRGSPHQLLLLSQQQQ
jgi:hypothetical protein